MRVTCQTCQAKYTIADEKVAGKVVKIKCKKCSSTIVVNGNDPSAGAQPELNPALAGAGEEEEGETKILVESGGSFPSESAGGADDEWTVNVTDDDQRTMTTPQIAKEIAAGVVTADTYVWKDGMADWLPVSEVLELGTFLATAPPASPPASASDVVFGAGPSKSPAVSAFSAAAPASVGASPASSASSGAARRAGAARGKVDLFGASKEPVAAAPPPAAPGPSGHVGERNENSVLFSLSALTATENAAKASPKKSEQGGIDLRPPKPKNGGRGNFDDIMNLGGGGLSGGITSAALAPPPLLAPVIEAPVRPVAPAVSAPMSSVPSSFPAPPAKKGGAGLIIGILVVLGLVGGAAFFFFKGSSPPAPAPIASPDSAHATAAPTATAATPVDTATAAATATAAPAPPDPTPSATPEATAAPTAPTAAAAVAAAATGTKPGAAVPPSTPGTKPGPAAPPPPAETAAAPASGGAEFSRSAAASALGAAAGSVKGCKKGDGPTGSGRVKVTFAPSGHVTTATVDGPPFSGTPMGGCIASAFRGAHVPPFDGSPVTVTKSFNIN